MPEHNQNQFANNLNQFSDNENTTENVNQQMEKGPPLASKTKSAPKSSLLLTSNLNIKTLSNPLSIKPAIKKKSFPAKTTNAETSPTSPVSIT